MLLPEPSFDGQTTTYHLREQSIHAIRQYSKFYQNNSTNPLLNALNSNNYQHGQTSSYTTNNAVVNNNNAMPPNANVATTTNNGPPNASLFAIPAGSGMHQNTLSQTSSSQHEKQQIFQQNHNNNTSIYDSGYMDYTLNSNASAGAQQQQHQYQQQSVYHHPLSSQLSNCPPSSTTEFFYTPQAGLSFLSLFYNLNFTSHYQHLRVCTG